MMSPTDATLSPSSPDVARPAVAASPGMWNVAEVVALLSLAAVSIAAFGWSAIALHGVAMMSGIPSWLAWGAPVIVDGPIIQAAWSLVALNRREKLGVVVPASTRRFFWAELAAAELVSFVVNGVHAWTTDGLRLPQLAAAAFAGLAPVAALTVTHALTVLLEVPRHPQPQATAGDSVAPEGDTEATAPEFEATPAESDATAARDAEILRMHLAGFSYRQIAPRVDLHPGTVGKIVARLKAEGDTTSGPLALPAPSNVRQIAG
ncbi:uncharacterized protein DUF2637 [Nocardia tenerifensis]|uniref:Uncharacterized protein DUF2637 n=1 Tax=Nocardia tenerifensis TaxID=228006 RepID=A0A318JRQ8_9NOCA|nr:DUF2637 domain-containing protein [Nocardia tenerifensis]PXX52273.1 uncharacterized protein DUF2637 [Nocardia tenerifensis]